MGKEKEAERRQRLREELGPFTKFVLPKHPPNRTAILYTAGQHYKLALYFYHLVKKSPTQETLASEPLVDDKLKTFITLAYTILTTIKPTIDRSPAPLLEQYNTVMEYSDWIEEQAQKLLNNAIRLQHPLSCFRQAMLLLRRLQGTSSVDSNHMSKLDALRSELTTLIEHVSNIDRTLGHIIAAGLFAWFGKYYQSCATQNQPAEQTAASCYERSYASYWALSSLQDQGESFTSIQDKGLTCLCSLFMKNSAFRDENPIAASLKQYQSKIFQQRPAEFHLRIQQDRKDTAQLPPKDNTADDTAAETCAASTLPNDAATSPEKQRQPGTQSALWLKTTTPADFTTTQTADKTASCCIL